MQRQGQRQEEGVGILSPGDYTRLPNNTSNHKVQSNQKQDRSPDTRHVATPSAGSDSSLVITPPLELDVGSNDGVDIQKDQRGDRKWPYNTDTGGLYTTGNDSRAEYPPAKVHPGRGADPIEPRTKPKTQTAMKILANMRASKNEHSQNAQQRNIEVQVDREMLLENSRDAGKTWKQNEA